MILTLASIGLPTTSGFTGEFLVLLGAFRAAWPLYVAGDEPAAGAERGRRRRRRAGRALHAALRAALPVRRGARRRTSRSPTSTGARRRSSALIVVAVFALGLFPDEPMRKTELAAKAVPATLRRRPPRARREEPRDELARPSWPRCCPSTCCSLGIVAADRASRSSAARAARRARASRSSASPRPPRGRAALALDGYAGGAVRRPVLGRRRRPRSPRRWCSRSRCRCC